MSVVMLLRRGFSPSPSVYPGGMETIAYDLGNELGPVWRQARATGAEYALLLDEAVPLDVRLLQLLLRVLESSPRADGVTFGTDALRNVYAAPLVRPRGGVAQTAQRLAALPSWFALLRMAAWPPVAEAHTPEFFLLQQAQRLCTFYVNTSRSRFDAITWCDTVLSTTIEQLAADYARFERKDLVPPQFRVIAPGVAGRLLEPVPTAEVSFSIIMPSIRATYLCEAVESVIAQTYPHWELRIGIDGPKEGHRQEIVGVLEGLAVDPRIHVRHFEHMGTGPVRRRLAEQSRGRYITTLDDDDRLPPTALERFARAIEETPGIPLLRGGIRIFGLVEDYLSPRRRYRVDGISNDLFEVNQPYVVRRDLLESLGGYEWDPNMRNAGEDSDLLLKADREGYRIHLIDEPLYERRLSTLNQTLDCSAEQCLQHIRNLYAKHNPSGKELADVSISGSDAMISMRTVHVREDRASQVVCSTSFMNFQQVGSREGVVIDLEVTSLCNAVCTFCPRDHLQRSRRFIDLEMVRRLAGYLEAESDPTVVLCGIGESTLHPELDEIVGILAEAGGRVCMTTNGSRLSPELVDRLAAKGLRELNVSLNAHSAEVHASIMRLDTFHGVTDTCAAIAANIERWPGLELHVSFVLIEANQHEVEDFVDAWDRPGIAQIWLHPMTNRAGVLGTEVRPARRPELRQIFADRPRVRVDLFPEADGPANLCRIARGLDFISVEGDMLLCAQDYSARHRFGSLEHVPVTQLHQTKILQHLRGTTAGTCAECSFCPRGFRSGADSTYTIVEAAGG